MNLHFPLSTPGEANGYPVGRMSLNSRALFEFKTESGRRGSQRPSIVLLFFGKMNIKYFKKQGGGCICDLLLELKRKNVAFFLVGPVLFEKKNVCF